MFGIASVDALSTIKNKAERDFLIVQREPGRMGTLGSFDISLAIKEKNSTETKESRRKEV